jgi:zinc protease
METPKATVLQVYSADMPYSVKNDVLLDAAVGYLEMVYTETLREGEGGTYGAGVASMTTREPSSKAILQVVFETNPESADKLAQLAIDGMNKAVSEGVPADKLDMIVKNLKKNIPQSRITNNYWLNCLHEYVNHGSNYDAEYEKAVDSITSDAIVATLKKLLQQKNFVQIKMAPEK